MIYHIQRPIFSNPHWMPYEVAIHIDTPGAWFQQPAVRWPWPPKKKMPWPNVNMLKTKSVVYVMKKYIKI